MRLDRRVCFHGLIEELKPEMTKQIQRENQWKMFMSMFQVCKRSKQPKTGSCNFRSFQDSPRDRGEILNIRKGPTWDAITRRKGLSHLRQASITDEKPAPAENAESP